jgi:hypothetical protein
MLRFGGNFGSESRTDQTGVNPDPMATSDPMAETRFDGAFQNLETWSPNWVLDLHLVE